MLSFTFLLMLIVGTLGTEEIAQEHERRQTEHERQQTIEVCPDKLVCG